LRGEGRVRVNVGVGFKESKYFLQLPEITNLEWEECNEQGPKSLFVTLYLQGFPEHDKKRFVIKKEKKGRTGKLIFS